MTRVITGFSHVQLVVRDVASSAEWYEAVLGLERFVSGTTDSGPYAGLRHPSAGFVVGMQTATEEQRSRLPGASTDHLSFAVADRAALEQARAGLAARGIEVGEVFEEAVSCNLRVRDPDGLVIELTAPKR